MNLFKNNNKNIEFNYILIFIFIIFLFWFLFVKENFYIFRKKCKCKTKFDNKTDLNKFKIRCKELNGKYIKSTFTCNKHKGIINSKNKCICKDLF